MVWEQGHIIDGSSICMSYQLAAFCYNHFNLHCIFDRNELCHKVGGKKVCVEYGRAYRGDMCNLPRSCQVATSAGFRTGFVIAHEMGHRYCKTAANVQTCCIIGFL